MEYIKKKKLVNYLSPSVTLVEFFPSIIGSLTVEG